MADAEAVRYFYHLRLKTFVLPQENLLQSKASNISKSWNHYETTCFVFFSHQERFYLSFIALQFQIFNP